MCGGNCNCNGNGNPIAVAFKNQAASIASVFARYGMAQMPVTPENALIGVRAHGTPFLKDLSVAASGLSFSYANGTDEDKVEIAATIFEIFGNAANAGINIAQGVLDIKNGNTRPVNQPTPGSPTIVEQPARETKTEEPKRYFGFTGSQLAILAGAVLLVMGTVMYLNSQNK